MEGNDEQPLALCEFAEFERFNASGGEGLVDDHVLACFEGLFGQREVRLVGRGDDDQLDGIIGQQLLDRARNPGCGICFCRVVAGALHDRRQTQPLHRVDERRMKDAPAQSVANYANANLPLCHYAFPISLSAG